MEQYRFVIKDASFDDLDALAGTLDNLLPGTKTMVMEAFEVITDSPKAAEVFKALFGVKGKLVDVADGGMVAVKPLAQNKGGAKPAKKIKAAVIAKTWKVIHCADQPEAEGKEFINQTLTNYLRSHGLPVGTVLEHPTRGRQAIIEQNGKYMLEAVNG